MGSSGGVSKLKGGWNYRLFTVITRLATIMNTWPCTELSMSTCRQRKMKMMRIPHIKLHLSKVFIDFFFYSLVHEQTYHPQKTKTSLFRFGGQFLFGGRSPRIHCFEVRKMSMASGKTLKRVIFLCNCSLTNPISLGSCFRATVLSQTLSLSTRCVERDKNNLPKVPKELRPVYNQNNSKQCRLVFENLGHLSGAWTCNDFKLSRLVCLHDYVLAPLVPRIDVFLLDWSLPVFSCNNIRIHSTILNTNMYSFNYLS